MKRSTSLRASAAAVFFVVILTGAVSASAQAPDEVHDLTWCADGKDCLAWSAADGALSYDVYRGRGQDLPGLLDGTADSCTVGTYAVTTTGDGMQDPGTGMLDWYLVTGANVAGEGPAGSGASGARAVDSTGPCIADAGGLVLNEVDYDQPGTDFDEFVEIYNAGTTDRDLSGVVLIFVNGLSQSEYRRIELSDAGPTLPAGDYLVVGTSTVVASLPIGTLSVTLASSSNNIQNGAPDGFALFDTGTTTLLDALSYEGSINAAQLDGVPGTFDLVEGTAMTAQDSNSAAGSLVRFPDGNDTDQADADWHFVPAPSAGGPNSAP